MPIFLLGSGLSTLPPRHSSQKRTSLSGRPAAVWAAPRSRRSQAGALPQVQELQVRHHDLTQLAVMTQAFHDVVDVPGRPHVSLHLGHEGFFRSGSADGARRATKLWPSRSTCCKARFGIAGEVLARARASRWTSTEHGRVYLQPAIYVYIYIYTSTYRYPFLCILRMHVLQCCSSTASRER